jgi:hypothetical protein
MSSAKADYADCADFLGVQELREGLVMILADFVSASLYRGFAEACQARDKVGGWWFAVGGGKNFRFWISWSLPI